MKTNGNINTVFFIFLEQLTYVIISTNTDVILEHFKDKAPNFTTRERTENYSKVWIISSTSV